MAVRQPCGDNASADQRGGSESQEADAPVEVIGQNSGGNAADESSESGSADVEAHDEGDAIGRPLLTDVGDHNGDDSGNHDALQEAPEDELRERSGSCRQQGGNRDAEDREDDDSFAGQPL